jgi:outer membrane protein TolC
MSDRNVNLSSRVIIAIVALAVISCQQPIDRVRAAFKPGTYDGFYIRREGQNQQQGFFSGTLAQGDQTHPAQGKFTDGQQVNFELDVESTQDPQLFNVTLKGLSDDVLVVKGDRFQDCLLSPDRAPVTARVCRGAGGITIEFSNASGVEMSLGFDPRGGDSEPTPVPPANYTLEDVVDQALKQSFDSKIKYEAALASRDNALEARANLLPHFHVTDALALVNATSWTSLIGLVGDAVPFLIPSNWFKASSASSQSDVDRYGYLIARADAGSTAEGLVYSLLRDEGSLAVLESYDTPIRKLRDQMAQAESVGAQPAGTASDLTAVLLEIDQMKVTYTAAINGGKRAIGQAMGISNADAVIDVKADHLPSLEHPVYPDPTATEKLVVDLSLELRQMDSMLIESQTQLRGKKYDWLDPSGTPLGFGLPASILAGQATVDEMRDQREKLQASLLEKVHQAYDTITTATKTYQIADQKVQLQQAQITRFQNDITLGRPVTGIDLQTALSAAMNSEIARVEANCSYYVAIGNLNRLLYIGQYAQSAITPLPTPDPSASPSPTPADSL